MPSLEDLKAGMRIRAIGDSLNDGEHFKIGDEFVLIAGQLGSTPVLGFKCRRHRPDIPDDIHLIEDDWARFEVVGGEAETEPAGQFFEAIPSWAGKVVAATTHHDYLIIACEFAVFRAGRNAGSLERRLELLFRQM